MNKQTQKPLKTGLKKAGGDGNLLQKALLLLLAVGGLAYMFSSGNEAPEQPTKPALEQRRPEEEAGPELKDQHIQYIAGANTGSCMIIGGRIHNPSNQGMAKIKLQARLFENGRIIREIETYAGRMLELDKLSRWDTRDIGNYLNSPYENDGRDSELIVLKPGASMPFMVIFSNVQNQNRGYELEIIDWQSIAGHPA